MVDEIGACMRSQVKRKRIGSAIGGALIFGLGASALVAGVAAHAAPGRGAQALAQLIFPEAPPRYEPASQAQRILDARLASLGDAFSGDVGIAVKDLQTGWISHFDGASYFPQQSVSKFWVTLAALDKADRGELNLDAPVTVRRTDLTVFNQPIVQQIRGDGYVTTLNGLIFRAMQQSDNTANDFVMRKAGGPDAVRGFLASKEIDGVRFGPGERLLQSQTAGLSWRQEYSIGNAFYAARAKVPAEARRAALDRYLADPIDGATPLGIVDALGRLKKGELLSRTSTQNLLWIMSNTKTGPQRLKGGLAPGWSLAHKTGTGQVLGAVSTGYNDIGIVTCPDGRSYAVAVLIRKTSAPIPTRMALMQNTVRAVIDYSNATRGYSSGNGYRAGR